ncbi:PASTA domain-containing protein [Pseudoclavibacter helvolus]
MVSVPNVVGQTARQAIATLEGAGFTVSHLVPSDALLDLFRVTQQTPAAGQQAEKGSRVTITTGASY